MGLERRGRVVQPRSQANWKQEEPASEAKPFKIPKRVVWEAFKRAKANQGAAGVGGQSIVEFEADLRNNLYMLWNRLSFGSYFPPPVRRVDIPKANGGTRPLGIPTVADRVAQEVAEDGCRQRALHLRDPPVKGAAHNPNARGYESRPAHTLLLRNDASSRSRAHVSVNDWPKNETTA